MTHTKHSSVSIDAWETLDAAALAGMGLDEFRRLARRKLSREVWEHLGATESGATLRRNSRAFRQFLFRERIFHDVTNPDLSVDLFGRRMPLPIGIAPLGSFHQAGAPADRGVAEAASSHGVAVFASHAARADVADWAQWSQAPLVFMGYLSQGHDAVLQQATKAEELGFAAVGLTMDGIRPTKLGSHFPTGRDGQPRRGHVANPKDITWLKAHVSVPVVVKGIMSPEDARIAVDSGADALIVSNHGGRQLDFGQAAIEVLPEVVEEVGPGVPVLLDSGIRSGGDVVKALALGARAVLLGRPIFWALAVAGVPGVERVLDLVEEEIRRVLVFTGTPSASQVPKSILVRADSWGK